MNISVVLITHNRADLLTVAIESVLAQNCPDLTYELIVVDDSSTDDTPAVLARYPQVRALRVDAKSSAAARNAGMRAAIGDWIAFLDDDDVWLPNRLAKTFAAVDSPDVVFVYAPAIITDFQLKYDPAAPAFWGGAVLDSEGANGGVSQATAFLDDLPCTSTVLLRRSALSETGEFEPAFGRAEDRDFWYKFVRLERGMRRVDEPLALYRGRAVSSSALVSRSFVDTMNLLEHHRAYFAARCGDAVFKASRTRTRRWYAYNLVHAVADEWRAGNRESVPTRLFQAFRIAPLSALKASASLFSGKP